MSQQAHLESALVELTLAEWFDLPENTPGELVDGRLVEEEVPDFIHEILVMLLGRLLGNWVFPEGGAVLGSEAKFALGDERGRKPDLSVYLPDTTLPPRRGPLRQPPDIAVEVVSPKPRDTRRDRVDKVNDYAAFGVRYYWIVDPELQSLEILELGPDRRYVVALSVTSGVVDPVPGCAGLRIDLNDLWQTVERLAPRSDPEQQD